MKPHLDLNTPMTVEEFAQWMKVSISTVARMPRNSPGRIKLGTCVRWVPALFLEAHKRRANGA